MQTLLAGNAATKHASELFKLTKKQRVGESVEEYFMLQR